MMDVTDHNAPQTTEASVFDIRRQARRRAWICPGAGFSLLGNRDLATITYAVGLLATGSAIFAVLNPSFIAFLVVLVLVVLSTLLWLGELITTYVGWPQSLVVPDNNAYIARAAILWSLFVLLAAILLATYGLLEVGGSGMSPLLQEKDKVLYRRVNDRAKFPNGTVILFRLHDENKFTEAGTLMLGRIMAGPGDKIYRREQDYYVNGIVDHSVAPDKPYPLALEIARYPNETTVPHDSFFVIQDAPERGLDSRVLSWARLSDIVSNELYLLRGPPPWRRVE